jgi:hypothetical protein
MSEKLVETVAKTLAKLRGYNPLCLESGCGRHKDGSMPNGDPAQFMWRLFVKDAKSILSAISSHEAKRKDGGE